MLQTLVILIIVSPLQLRISIAQLIISRQEMFYMQNLPGGQALLGSLRFFSVHYLFCTATIKRVKKSLCTIFLRHAVRMGVY